MLNLYEIMSVTGQELVAQSNIDQLKASFQGEDIVVTCKEPFYVTAKHVEKGIVSISFEVTVDVERVCSRCLSKVNCEYHLSIFRNIDVANKEAYIEDASEADGISYIEDCNLDVDMLVLDELYTILPMNVICKEDCKGICKVCGTNLNESTCNCDQTVPDPRMAVFSDIFNQFKEV